MKYFTEEIWDFEGYQKHLFSLKETLDEDTFDFLQTNSFHDGILCDITVHNPYTEKTEDIKSSIVFVTAKIKHWNGQVYTLLWKNVTVYQFDFNISRNKVVETNEILFDRGLDEWSHDELTLNEENKMQHEIDFFSKTRLLIECSDFSIGLLDSLDNNCSF